MNEGYKKVNGLELAQMAIALEKEVQAGGILAGKTAVLKTLAKVYEHLIARTYMIKEDELDEIRAFTTRF